MRSIPCVLMFCFMLLLTADAGAQGTNKQRKLALLVGVSAYDHSSLAKLRFPENDVRELGALLTGQGYEVVVLSGSNGSKSPELSPTSENIREQLSTILTNVTQHDLIVVGLAGHGLQLLDQEESYFCPSNANPSTSQVDGKEQFDKPETLISIGSILESLRKSGIGNKIVLVDACRSEPIAGSRRGITPFKQIPIPNQTGIMLSCAAGEYAFESEKLGNGHGVFFYHIIEGLKHGAADDDGEVTWGNLTSYVQKRVPKTVGELFGALGGEQSPHADQRMQGAQCVITRVDISDNASTSTVPTPIASPKADDGGFESQTAFAAKIGRDIEEVNSVGIRFVLIPPGGITVKGAKGQMRVGVEKPFMIAKTEITQAQWEEVMRSTPWKSNRDVKKDPACPAACISLKEAMAFCKKLTDAERKQGKLAANEEYTLPTEMQWEWSCRAGAMGRLNFDGAIARHSDQSVLEIPRSELHAALTKYCCFDDLSGNTSHADVTGKRLPNAFGLHDTLGNIAEWCLVTESPQTGVIRGGSWRTLGKRLKVETRDKFDNGNSETGFRPIRTLK